MSQANKLPKSVPLGGVHISHQQQQQVHMNGNQKQINQQNQVQSQNNGNQGSSQQGYNSQKNDDLGLHRTQMKSNTIENLSRVLLVIFNTHEMKTNQDLFDMFSPYVRVLRVLIFERKESNIKCFVEMVTQAEATYVKNQFQFQKTKNQQRNFQIYYSQIPTIDLQNHYSEGQDFSTFYATNPTFTCQYVQENANLFSNTALGNSQLHTKQMNSTSNFQGGFQNNKQSQQSQSQQSGYFNNFGQPNISFNSKNGFPQPFMNSQQFMNNQVPNEIEPNFDPNSPFMEGGVRPSSISSIDYQLQSHFHLSQNHHPSSNINNSSHPLSHFNNGNNVNLTSRHTVHGNPMAASNTPLESKVYAHIKHEGPQQQSSQKSMNQNYQQQHMQRNPKADQFHKDFMIKDNILQNHINQQFQQSAQKSALLSPFYNNQQGGQKVEINNNLPPISLNSSTNRSPSSTSYSLTNNNNLNNQYDSDIDENVQVSQPSTFHTKYRDVQFFNGMSNGGYIEDGENQQTFSNGIINQAFQHQNHHDDNIQTQQIGGDQEAKKVLFVRHLDYPDLKISMLYNLFSNYGNIVKIIFMKQKRQALIEFEHTSQATAAKEYLNNLLYYNAQIKIDYSKYDQIDLQRKKLHSGENNEQEQVLSIPQQLYRYKNKKVIPQYAPKNTLHVSNIRKEYFVQNLLYEFFSASGAKINNLKLIPNEKKQMCLIQFETLDDALRVISTLHDTPFHGRNLCISFTKSTNQIQQTQPNSNNPNMNYPHNSNIDHQMLIKQQQLHQQQQYNIQINSNNINQNQKLFQQQQQQQYKNNSFNNFSINNYPGNNNYAQSLASNNGFNNFDLTQINDTNYHQYYDVNDDSDDDIEVDNSIKYLDI